MGKTLYLECYSGISGDMTVGALLDLGADRAVLERVIASLGIDGYHLHFGRKQKCGIDAYDFDVHLEETGSHGHDHTHVEEDSHSHIHSHGEGESHSHIHGHAEKEGHSHVHSHGETGDHDHTHEEHAHSHVHRNLGDITTIIERMNSADAVKQMAKHMFQIVAEAESKAHGIPVEKVHFHEVGAVDSIIDIVSVAVCIHNLGIDKVIVSPLAEGQGYVRCQHGVMPVPVPATSNIVSAYGLRMKRTDQEGEMVTPTGAAIAAALNSKERLPEFYTIQRIGIGAGNKDFKQANILRAMLIEPAAQYSEDEEELWMLESNIDDCSGEMLGFAMESLLKAGAADVWYSPVFMKKNRPAYTLKILCKKALTETMEDLVFAQTTTIGIRRYQVSRTILERKQERVMTAYGEIVLKVCTHKDHIYYYPEYESVSAVCRETGEDFGKIYQLAVETARKKKDEKG